MSSKPNIVFMGTPDFAVPSLQAVAAAGHRIAAVVTAPDKPAGRGRKLSSSAIKEAALELGLKVLQPENLRSDDFIQQLRSLRPDLMIVVAFRILPESVWAMPSIGTFNLHASLLPQYRGAAPMNWALINGEAYTGLTTFFLKQAVDTGNVLMQERIGLDDNMTFGELHDIMKVKGAELVIRTIDLILDGNFVEVHQDELSPANTILRNAPKLHRELCRISWDKDVTNIHNLVRGLSPLPGAFSVMERDGIPLSVRFLRTIPQPALIQTSPGYIEFTIDKRMGVHCADGILWIQELQIQGKKAMSARDFINGFKPDPGKSYFFH